MIIILIAMCVYAVIIIIEIGFQACLIHLRLNKIEEKIDKIQHITEEPERQENK